MEKDWNRTQKESGPVVSRKLANEGKKAVRRINEILDTINTAHKTRASASQMHNKNITEIAYRGEEPFTYNLFFGYREMHNLIPTLQELYDKKAITGTDPSNLEKDDLFGKQFKGLSLIDIENMELNPDTHELAPNDIKKINRMFRSQGLLIKRKDRDQTKTLELLIYFASQQWIHPETSAPRSLEKFQENITAYFDYYTSFLTDFNRDYLNESTMLLMLALGAPYLSMAVASYAPARLNITPSSATKLYKQREDLADPVFNKETWRRLEKLFFPVFEQAYRNDSLPKDLEQYQHYNEEADCVAANILQNYMKKTASAEEQIKTNDEVKIILEQWNKHKRNITREMRQLNKRLEYKISQDHPTEGITMVKNRDTFVFVMHFPNNIHLTLEIDKTGKLFGVPPSLIKANPHVEDALMVTILSPLLKKYESKETDSNTLQIPAPLYLIPRKPEVPEGLIQEEEEQVTKPPKRKRLIPAVTIFEADPSPPIIPTAPRAERFVAYSLEELKELLGPQVSRQHAIVDRVLRAINNFERGNTFGITIERYHGSVIRIRAGDYRILLNRLGNKKYTLKEITNRKNAY